MKLVMPLFVTSETCAPEERPESLGQAFTGASRVPMDSLEEFRVTTTNANARA
jgi:hypothetical protein